MNTGVASISAPSRPSLAEGEGAHAACVCRVPNNIGEGEDGGRTGGTAFGAIPPLCRGRLGGLSVCDTIPTPRGGVPSCLMDGEKVQDWPYRAA